MKCSTFPVGPARIIAGVRSAFDNGHRRNSLPVVVMTRVHRLLKHKPAPAQFQ
jgi:hypothetical protein